MLRWEQLDCLLVAVSELVLNQMFLELEFQETGEKIHQVTIQSFTL
jgi:hypothetical protein